MQRDVYQRRFDRAGLAVTQVSRWRSDVAGIVGRRLTLDDLQPVDGPAAVARQAVPVPEAPAEPERPPAIGEAELAAACMQASLAGERKARAEAAQSIEAQRIALLESLDKGLAALHRRLDEAADQVSAAVVDLVGSAMRGLLLGREGALRQAALEALLQDALRHSRSTGAVTIGAAPADAPALAAAWPGMAEADDPERSVSIVPDPALAPGQVSLVQDQSWAEIDLGRWIEAIEAGLRAALAARPGGDGKESMDDEHGEELR